MARISDQMERAVTAMEADRECWATLQRLERRSEAQERNLETVLTKLDDILDLFGAPLEDPGRR